MAVQFNLLPDVKLEFNRAQHAKRVVYTLSFLACGVAVALFVISFLAVNVLQKQLLNNANNDINNYSNQLKKIPDLDKILTVQNQLSALPGLHDQKHYASRLFGYLRDITPANVNIGKIDVDMTANSLTISGTADKVENVNKFVDTMKFTTFKATDATTANQAFTNVLLSKIDRDDKGASYEITTTFDASLFTGATSVSLNIPQETTTRSVLNAPSTSNPLFNGQTQTKSQQQTQGGQ